MLIIDCELRKIESAVFLRDLLVTMDAPAPNPAVDEPLPLAIKKPNLTSEGRRTIITTLLLAVRPDDPDMKLPYGAIKSCADTHNVTRWTIKRIWERALANHRNPHIRAFISSPEKNLVVHKSGIETTFAALSKSSRFIKREPFEGLLPRWRFPNHRCSA